MDEEGIGMTDKAAPGWDLSYLDDQPVPFEHFGPGPDGTGRVFTPLRGGPTLSEEHFDQGSKDTNPKQAYGDAKIPLGLFPDTAIVAGAIAFAEGAAKYGAYNWRGTGVRASTYLSALDRHVKSWKNGEDCDPISGVHHLYNAMACLAILIDSMEVGCLVDDRPPEAPVGDMLRRHADTVARLKELYADRDPKHWTIGDPVHREPAVKRK